MAGPTYKDFVDQILRPTNLERLKPQDPYEKIIIRIFQNPNSPEPTEELELENLYPFHTIADLQTNIYIAKDLEEAFHPYNQCLLLPVDTSSTPYLHFQYIFNDRSLSLANPFTLIRGKPDGRFVDLNGAPKNPKTVSREAVTLQTALFHNVKDSYTIDLFLYNDILSVFPGERPISRVDWEGKFRVYFPIRNKDDENGQVPDSILGNAPDRAERFINKLKLIEKADEFLQENPLRVPGEKGRGDPIGLANFRNLRFAWKKPSIPPGYEPLRLDSLFYDIPVSKLIPYIRFYPKSTVPLSKVCVDGPLNIPLMEKPEVLKQWSQEPSLTPQEDLIMIKFLIREGSGSINPLYGTLFILEDGSAKAIVQPNQDVKSISRVELATLGDILDSLMKKIPSLKPTLANADKLPVRELYSPRSIYLEEAYVVFTLWLEKGEDPVTISSIKKLLPFFRPFFQVTSSPIKEQNPLSFLRYKGVDNFRTPSRDFQFLHRVIDLQQLSGQSDVPALIKLYQEEFETDETTAKKRVGDFLKSQVEFETVNPEIMEIGQTENPGIDIAIFGKQNQYTFHLYRVDSVFNLKMIKTLLSILVSVEPSFYKEAESVAASNVAEEEQLEEEIDAEVEAQQEKVGGEEVPNPALVAASALGESGEDGFEFDELGLQGFEEEEEIAFAPPQEPQDPRKALQQAAKEDTPEVRSKKQVAKEAEAQEAEAQEAEEVQITAVTKSAKNYFLNRLQKYDRKLFVYPLAPGDDMNYGRQCSAAAGRQPTIMSEDEYKQMREVYEEDEESGDVIWIDYPVKKGADIPDTKKATAEVVTTIRYGSSLLPGQANIFICCLYWCRNDEIVVLIKDFEATVDKKGKPKPKNTCPFCRGGLVKDKNKIVPGESVISRAEKKEINTFVGFLKKSNHPDDLRLPCCFKKDKRLEDSEPEFKTAVVVAPKPQEETPLTSRVIELKKEVEEDKSISTNYAKKLASITTSYIIGSEKLPLQITPREGPQIGVLPPLLDKFFGQNSSSLVKQDHTVWKLLVDNKYGRPNVSGFFRIAAENRKQFQAEAFLSAVAPYFGLNSSADLKHILKQIIQPPVFLNLNYGNFLFDFYNPQMGTPPNLILKSFAQKRLLLASGMGIQKEALVRAWKGYYSFEKSMEDTTVYKEYRQYAPLLSQPLLVSSAGGFPNENGILFIVLEVRGSEVTVRCPPYGVSADMAKRCDIAFISYYPTMNIWEPIFYSANNAEANTFTQTLVFKKSKEASWPPIVKKRYDEFIEMCNSSGLGFYTDSPEINPKTLIPLSVAMNLPGATVYGILRDTYNHVSAILYEVKEMLVVVPVIDDGIVVQAPRIELDWRNIMTKLAPGNIVKIFYQTRLNAVLKTLSPAIQEFYRIDKLIRLDKTVPDLEDIYAFHLAGGLFVPVLKPSSPLAALEEIEESEFREGQELPWSIDVKLSYGELKPSITDEIDHKEFEEIYQHLRLTFANWFALATPDLKQEINEILFLDGEPNINLPLYEKRKRLEIKLGNEVLSWLDSTIPQRGKAESVKRVDCRIIKKQEDCSNRCVWKEDSETCLLHTVEQYEVGEKYVDAKQLLLKKLIEELIRFPERRDQLLTQQVSKYQVLRDGFRYGNQYIVPENVPAWTDLLRMDWKVQSKEIPKYIEEFSFSTSKEKEEEKKPEGFPEVLKNLFGAERASALTFIPSADGSIWSVLNDSFDIDIDEFEEKSGVNYEIPVLTEQKEVNELVKEIKFSFIQILYEAGSVAGQSYLSAKGINPDNSKADIIFFVKLPDDRAGFISSAPDGLMPVPLKSLPANLRIVYAKAPTIQLT